LFTVLNPSLDLISQTEPLFKIKASRGLAYPKFDVPEIQFWRGDPKFEALSKKPEDAFFACNGLFENFKSTNGIFRIHKCLVGFP
jgi:hypothetical protein